MEARLAEGVRHGEPRALARALTLVENDGPAGARLLAALRVSASAAATGAASPTGGTAHRVGITGPPGVGKSTLLGRLAASWRAEERRVGILAVDPTSPFSGGALLGDRVRLGALHGDAGVFIRSLASRGASGGLSLAVHDAADVLEAAAFDPVVVETVGVGQAEVDIARAADTTVLVLAPGGGDEIQAMKAGLLEAADLIVVNQADRPDAGRMVRGLEAGLALRSGDAPEVFQTVATTGQGVLALREAIDARLDAASGAEVAARRLDRARRRIRALVDRRRAAAFWADHETRLEALALEVLEGEDTVAGVAARLLDEGEER